MVRDLDSVFMNVNLPALHIAVMGENLRHLRALLWLKFKIRCKHPIQTCFTTFLPTLFSVVILLAHQDNILVVDVQAESWIPIAPSLCPIYEHRKSSYCTGDMRKLAVYYTPQGNVTQSVMAMINKDLKQRQVGT